MAIIVSNVVSEEKLREVQEQTLEVLSSYLKKSFGPCGSNSTIGSAGYAVEYTKDGKDILEHIQFMGVIENCIRQDIWTITKQVVKEVGDGTTSAVLLSNEIFKGLLKLGNERQPYQVIRDFKSCVDKIVKRIMENKQEMTLDKVYDIAYLSTNGNHEIANNIREIYEEYGMDVFIDVSISLTEHTAIKVMDGMNLESGISNSAYINNPESNSCDIRSPKIYAFKDPVENVTMSSLLDKIIYDNILEKSSTGEYIPTVIIAPRISRDKSYYINSVVDSFNNIKNVSQRPPLLIIEDIFEFEKYEDIVKMCGCTFINRYIDPDQYKVDVENGLAPTPDNIHNFAGTCDLVSSDTDKTKFVNPSRMRDGEDYSAEYKSLLFFIEKELDKAIKNGENAQTIGTYRRRLQSIKGNLIDYLVGGISAADRDSDRALIEDAVLNIRSAVNNGYGRAANYEGFHACRTLQREQTEECEILDIIVEAYENLITQLYETAGIKFDLNEFFDLGLPINIRTGEPDGKVISSIKTDVTILTAISKIVTLMYTSNQFICNDIAANMYR